MSEKNSFRVEQSPNWELVQGGEFSSVGEAVTAMHELEIVLGWRGMRVTERTIDGSIVSVLAEGAA